MSDQPVAVHILDREFLVACEPGERDSLREAARYLDTRMREIRDSGRIVGQDRIAVMAALNIAHELLEQGRRVEVQGDAGRRIERLSRRIGRFLEDGTGEAAD
ncbi:cell division protein ZapA [Arhodomonas sp. SL1]|uniref:cell division protein ZapA n=1 Tax=Arhodomonas sp. SL1 TaxID=3425691 RepID=UPI003F885462